jgi:hypothetical protein
VSVRVLDEVGERTLERRALAPHPHRPRRTSLHGGVSLRSGPREQVEPDLLDRSFGSLLT